MKRVIDGKAYNTETAQLIHEYLENDDDTPNPRHPFGMAQHPYAERLYRTRLGKFFLVLRHEPYINPAIQDGGDLDLQDRIVPLEPEPAMKWMEKHCNEKITDFVEVPEAGEPSTTLTLRLDKVLKILLGAAAVKDAVSLNGWCVRVLEAAVKDKPLSTLD
jgi:hypothetical protein